MFSALLAAPCELKLHLLQHTIFLRPPTRRPAEDAPPTSTDEVARGLVELNVPHDRRIGGIRVKLRAVQSVAILADQREMAAFAGSTPIAWEDTVLMEKIVDIGLSARKSHATVPGDDSISSAERRGRSRQRSRMVTPMGSQPSSPRVSVDGAPLPPGYEESEAAAAAEAEASGSAAHQPHGFGAAIARALSRGRPLSRPSSRSNSRSQSQAQSRVPSRAQSRTHSRAPSPTPSGRSTPTHAPLVHTQSNDSDHSDLRRQPSSSADDADTISGVPASIPTGQDTHISRTGLQSDVAGPHPTPTDRHDYFGVFTSALAGAGRRIQDSVPSSPDAHRSEHSRSSTLSPSRLRGKADRSRSRLPFRRDSVPVTVDENGTAVTPPASGEEGRSPRRSSDEEDGLFLQKGVHGFEFAFIIPSDSAPFERSPYGRVRYIVKATAFGAGRAKSNLEAWSDMFPVVNPSTDGGPVPLSVVYNDMHPTVGLISIACTSSNISVGGIFNIDIHSPTPPEDLIVYLVRVSVETNTELRTRKKGKQQVPTQRHKLFEKGYVPPRPNDPHGQGDGKRSEGLIRDPTKPGSRADDAWTVQGIGRMPNDNIVRSSTTPGTRASIRFSHQLLVEIVHSRHSNDPAQDRKLKVFALRQPIILPSCCVAYDSVILPAYTPAECNRDAAATSPSGLPYDLTPNSSSVVARSSQQTTTPRLTGVDHSACVCGQTLDDLTERERALIPARSYVELPLDGLSHRKIGELPDNNGSSRMNMSSLGSALRRSTSRSSRESRERSTSRIRRSLSRGMARSPSTDSRGSGTMPRINGRGRGGYGNGPYANGAGERGEGIIRTSARGTSIPPPPPAYKSAASTSARASGEQPDDSGQGSSSRDEHSDVNSLSSGTAADDEQR